MPCVVLSLTDGIKIVKSECVEKVNSAESRISGTSPNVLVKIFHSVDKHLEPNFQLEPQEHEELEQLDNYVEYGYVLKICGECNKFETLFNLSNFKRYFLILDTYKEAKSYAAKKRSREPVNYCESPKKKKCLSAPKGHRKRIADVIEKIQVKSERYTNLKKALYIANCENNKKYTDDVEEMDLDEYQALLGDEHVPQNEEDICNERSPINDGKDDDCIDLSSTSKQAEPNSITIGANQMTLECSLPCDGEDDDCIELPSTSNQRTERIAITIGVDKLPLEIDEEFSCQYSYTTDVR